MKTAVMALTLVAGLAQADTLYRCIGSDGRLTWTNQACAAGETAEAVKVQPVATDSSGLREWARRSPAAKAPRERKTARAREPRYIDPVECGNARRAFEFEMGWKFRKKEELAYRRREVKRHCGYLP